MRHYGNKAAKAYYALAGLAVTALCLASGCASPSPKAAPNAVITFAEQPAQPPNYILPLESSAEESNANFGQFSNILYPPLYTFDAKGSPALSEPLSIAYPPVFSDQNTVVSIRLKRWSWSNGKPLTARDVMFWMNLLSAVTDPHIPAIGTSSAPGPGWGFFVPGGFPENVVSYTQTGTYSLILRLNQSYNPTWFTFNELSQITPMPQSVWDKLSLTGPTGNYDIAGQKRIQLPGTKPALYVPKNPGTATSGALGVAEFLNAQSQDVSTYNTNALWKVVDGPFRISTYNVDGFLKLVPNATYSGSIKPKVKAFEELPFTSDASEFLALKAGTLTIGYLPPQDLGQRGSFTRNGYSFSAWNVYGIGFAPYNFTNPTAGPLFKQLYFRQAFQYLVDQEAYISDFYGGVGSMTTGPVPAQPKTSYTAQVELGQGRYPYDPAKAVSLLREHGWRVVPGGASYCASPGTGPSDCGQGVKAGQAASFTVLYASGNTAGADSLEVLQSTARKTAGVDLSLKVEPFGQVISTEFGGCSPSTPCSAWGIADLFVGWTFGPDYLPVGGELFGTGAGSNAGYYSSAANDSNIAAVHTAPNRKALLEAMDKYETYLADQLPVVWLPMEPLQLTEYRSYLHGLLPQGIIDQVFPQLYSI